MEELLEEILEIGCGLDVHKDKIEACILRKGDKVVYRETFGCISSELNKLCNWLNSFKCKNIAMESTGVYWMPVYERIEENPGDGSLCITSSLVDPASLSVKTENRPLCLYSVPAYIVMSALKQTLRKIKQAEHEGEDIEWIPTK